MGATKEYGIISGYFDEIERENADIINLIQAEKITELTKENFFGFGGRYNEQNMPECNTELVPF